MESIHHRDREKADMKIATVGLCAATVFAWACSDSRNTGFRPSDLRAAADQMSQMRPSTVASPVRTAEQLAQADGKRATLIGLYRRLDARQNQEPPPVYRGHALLVLSDGERVYLEPSWSDAAIRSAAEQASFDGQRVELTGIVHRDVPPPPQDVNYILGACISPVEHIRLARP